MISYKITRFLRVLYVLVESCSYNVFCLILYGHFSDLGSFSVCSRKVLVGPKNSVKPRQNVKSRIEFWTSPDLKK